MRDASDVGTSARPGHHMHPASNESRFPASQQDAQSISVSVETASPLPSTVAVLIGATGVFRFLFSLAGCFSRCPTACSQLAVTKTEERFVFIAPHSSLTNITVHVSEIFLETVDSLVWILAEQQL